MATTLTTPLTPSHLTILLKHHKSTVLLSVLPSTSLTSLKTLLLAALTSRGIVAFPSASISTSLPTNPDDLQLGVLVDKKDPSKGFKLLVETPSERSGGSKKGKSRASNYRAGGSTATAGDGGEASVEAAGLVDGSWVAYRIRPAGASSSGKAVKDEEDDDEGDEDDEEGGDAVIDIDMEGDPGWDVVVPSFEEMDAEAVEKAEEGAEDGCEDDIPIPDVTGVR